MMKSNILAGTSIIDVSPKKGVELAGYPHFLRHNTGVNDPLYASCIYLKNGTEEIVIITVDIVFISKKYITQIRKEISDKSSVPEKNIMICCSHTHSGPWASGRLDVDALLEGLEPDKEYVSGLKNKLVSAALEAADNTFEAAIATGMGYCGAEQGVGGNRRDPKGISDPEVGVLAVKDETGNIRAAIVNYALHPTLLDAENTLVSADYPGYIRKQLKKSNPEMNMLFMQGCSGNQSTRYFRNGQTFDEADRIGTAIADEIKKVLESMKYINKMNINVETKEIEMKIRKFPDKKSLQESLAEAKKQYDHLIETNAPYIETQNANVKLLGAEDILGYIEMIEKGKKIELLEDEKPVEIQVINSDYWSIAAFPGEMFVEFGLKIKSEIENKDVFVAAVSNGCLPGYVYTKESLKAGGYETDTSMLAEDMGDIMTDQAIAMLKGEGKTRG